MSDLVMIGEFARRARLPVSTLRYYDKIGLLEPVVTDPETGYRWYGLQQLRAATQIAGFRAAGLAPDMIAVVLNGGLTAQAALRAERDRLASEMQDAADKIRLIDRYITDEIRPPGQDVRLVERESVTVATRLFTTPNDNLEQGIRDALAELAESLERSESRRVGRWGAILPLDLGSDTTGRVFAATGGCGDTGVCEEQELPAGPAVTTTHCGPLDRIADAYAAIFEEMDRSQLTAAGPVIEEYAGYRRGPGGRVRIYVPVCVKR